MAGFCRLISAESEALRKYGAAALARVWSEHKKKP
jgi:hypothetical protein